MSRNRAMQVDFAAGRTRSTGLGWLFCAIGLAAAVTAGFGFERALAERERLDGAVEAMASQKRPRIEDPLRAKEQAEFSKMSRQLAIPWTRLLAELESASADMADKVSLLQVQPDADKRIVRITAEVRSLPDALAYLERLQKSTVLRFPLLESHERLKDDPEHAVRIKLAADWQT